MRLLSHAILKVLIFYDLLLCYPSFSFSLLAANSTVETELLLPETNVTAVGNASLAGSNEDSLANMIDRALEREFPENEQNEGTDDAGSFNNSVAGQQAVLETVARVKPKKNETKEEKSFQFHDVFNLDNENRVEDTPTLIDRKDNVFIISNPKSKYPVLQLDLRLISDLVVVIVSATCGGIAFACAGQPVMTGYLLAGSLIGPGGLSFVSEMVQVETVAQFGVIFLLFALGLEFSTTKLRVVRAVAILGGLLQILLFMCLCGIIASEQLQAEMQSTQCENEAFVKVFGKDHAGYVRSMGLGITPSQISSQTTRSASSSIEANEKMLKMQAEIDSLKDKASQVDILKAQVAFLMQMQMQNSHIENEPTNLGSAKDGRHSSDSSYRLEDH